MVCGPDAGLCEQSGRGLGSVGDVPSAAAIMRGSRTASRRGNLDFVGGAAAVRMSRRAASASESWGCIAVGNGGPSGAFYKVWRAVSPWRTPLSSRNGILGITAFGFFLSDFLSM